MTSTLAHTADCLCPPCLIADMDAHVAKTQGQEALDRINVQMSALGGGKVEAVKTRSLKAGQRVGRGYVRSMSPKQRKYLVFLINTKNTTGLKLLPGQTINLKEIDTMGLPAATAVIDKLTACPDKPSVSVRMATDGQKNFIRTLNGQSGNTLTEADIDSITFAEVNDVLALLKRMAEAWKAESTVKIEVGGYIQESTQRVFNVYKARAGHLLIKELNKSTKSWDYVGSVHKMPKDVRPLTLDEAQQFGKATGQCCICSRTLTKAESIKAGIGPICASRYA